MVFNFSYILSLRQVSNDLLNTLSFFNTDLSFFNNTHPIISSSLKDFVRLKLYIEITDIKINIIKNIVEAILYCCLSTVSLKIQEMSISVCPANVKLLFTGFPSVSR